MLINAIVYLIVSITVRHKWKFHIKYVIVPVISTKHINVTAIPSI